MKKRLSSAAAILLAVSLTGCSSQSGNGALNGGNVAQENLEMGKNFAPEAQITALESPCDFSSVSSLVVKPYEDKPINRETLGEITCETIKVKVYLKFNEEDALSQNKWQLSGLVGEEYQRMKQSIVKTEISRMINRFISDYEIAAESISGIGIYIPQFTAELDTALISQMIEDERVELILEAIDDVGIDWE